MSGGGYDPEARRDTPLALKLMERIAAQGSLPLYDYVHACMFDAEFGYYRRQPAIGASGDFVTAPEISQTFGELIGLWAAAVWQSMGSPRSFHLIEYGAGRGTLMRDALRAAAVLPGFLQAARISLCDINPALREMQRATLRAEVALLGEEKLRFVEVLTKKRRLPRLRPVHLRLSSATNFSTSGRSPNASGARTVGPAVASASMRWAV